MTATIQAIDDLWKINIIKLDKDRLYPNMIMIHIGARSIAEQSGHPTSMRKSYQCSANAAPMKKFIKATIRRDILISIANHPKI